ncbi:MAG: DUF58 domain-containing protein [Acidimicrobiales bacterium]
MTPVPTARFALVALVSAGVALVLPVSLVAGILLVNGALVTVALGDFVASAGPRRITVGRVPGGALTVDADADLVWTVANAGGGSVRVMFADALPPSFTAARRRISVTVPARSTVTVTLPVRPHRRGRHRLEAIAVRCPGPLGLVGRQWNVRAAAEIRVVPRLRDRAMVEQAIAAARRMELGEKRPVVIGGATEFESLREYTPGDEYRRIDWSATARRGRPIVRTYRTPQYQSVVCLLDAGRVMSTAVAGSPRLEHAIEGVLALSTLATRLGDRVGLVTFDRRIRGVVAPSSDPAHVRAVTEGLFDLEPALVESDYAGAVRGALSRLDRRTLVVLFTDLVDGAVEDSLLPALPTVLGRHLLVVAATREVAVAPGSPTGSVDAAADLHQRVAGERALAARNRSAARLEGLGVEVIDAAPDRFAVEIVESYLAIKATGRL